MQFSSGLTGTFVLKNYVLQENVGSGLSSDQNKGDLGNSETGNGEYQS